MIQLNLLPDVKMQYVKAQRTRGLVLSSAFLIAAASVALLVILLIVGGLQKKHINDLSKDIKSESSELQKKPDIEKTLTVQNQLLSLSDLHAQKPAVSRLFGYLNQVTPTKVGITSFTIDFTQQTITITGTADSLGNINKYVDTLKYTKFTSDDSGDSTAAFKDVVLSSFALSTTGGASSQAATYTVTMAYDQKLFDVTNDTKLTVPSTVTTRSQPDQANDLFQSSGSGGSN